MDPKKKKRLEAAGYKVGSAAEFLGLSEVEERIVAMKIAMARKIRALRKSSSLTQNQLAECLGSSQSRVAKLEVADKSVSMDLLLRAMVTLNASDRDFDVLYTGVKKKSAKKQAKVKRTAVKEPSTTGR